LWNANAPAGTLALGETEKAAAGLGVKVHPVEIRQAEELDDAIVRAQAKGLIVFADLLTFSHRQRIVQTASQRGLATASGAREFVGAGGVLSYGPSFPEMFRHAAMYVDKLLNGAKSAELPVEQPTKFELVLNLKTAKTLGLTMPQTLLGRANQIIE